jgi:hypothetical protein
MNQKEKYLLVTKVDGAVTWHLTFRGPDKGVDAG